MVWPPNSVDLERKKGMEQKSGGEWLARLSQKSGEEERGGLDCLRKVEERRMVGWIASEEWRRRA